MKTEVKEALKDQRVVNEINKHLWIESEKSSYDIGFDRAAEDWITKYYKDWKKTNSAPMQAAKTSRISTAMQTFNKKKR